MPSRRGISAGQRGVKNLVTNLLHKLGSSW
jgi:hypothetical protein